jgi:two-component system chemotaxis response regulator CheB
MKKKLTDLSRRYVIALEKHLKKKPGAGLPPALGLGREAVALGLETLDLARIHEQALATLGLSDVKNAFTRPAGIFFSQANTPIEKTHRAAWQAKIHLGKLKATLNQRTAELAISNHELQQGVVRHKVMTEVYEKNGKGHEKSLEESLQLQNQLRRLTHRVIAAQEDERTKISHELQDEIAQTLLAINVRLLSLKRGAGSNIKGLHNEIANTQRLVVKSAKSVRRFARELGTHLPKQSNPSVPPNFQLWRAFANRIVTNKPLPKRRPKETARTTRAITPASAAVPAPVKFPVIAMAASVGGLKALSVILGGLPADFPAAIAIVMHVAPDHESLLAEILNRRTDLVVKQAHTGDFLRPACAFIAPPNHHLLAAKNGRLKLSSVHAKKIHFARPSAEPLFASVAAAYKKNAIAVVLTGGDGDGSFGVQIIKDKGGLVIAQDRSTSQDFSMPRSSIETGDVDFILPLQEIASKLIELAGAGKELKHGHPPAKMALTTPALQNW